MENPEIVATRHCPCDMFRQVPMAWFVSDRESRVIDGNQLFWDEVASRAPAPAGTPLEEALPEGLLSTLRPAIDRAINMRESVELPGVILFPPSQPNKVVDLVVVPATTSEFDGVMVVSSTVGDTGRRVAELTILNDMIRVLRQELETERVLFTTLTCATAGSGGLGFNRAWVMLVDSTGEWLEGRMAIGPASEDEAHDIWAALTAQPRTLEEFAAAYDRWAAKDHHPLSSRVQKMRFSMTDEAGQLPVLATAEGRAITVKDASENPWVGPQLRETVGADEFVVCPMIVKNEACGVIMADNLYSGAPITRAHVRMLSLFAQHAGIAIEDAQLHQQMEAYQGQLEETLLDLSDAQDQLVRSKQLAVLGEMSARVAHDLRNPLVTLGGWARVVQEDPSDTHTVVHAANIIAEEAANLEAILSMLLEPFASRNLRLEPTDINQIMGDTLAAQGNKLEQRDIEVIHELGQTLPLGYGYQGEYPEDKAGSVGCLFDPESRHNGVINFMATGIRRAQVINTVSERYAEEIQDPVFGCGLEDDLQARAADLHGVLNGIDTDAWNPSTDAQIPANYSAADMSGKAKCKAALQKQMGLPVDPDVPLLGCVSRLAHQKGLDVLTEVLVDAIRLPMQFALLGTGEGHLEARYTQLAAAHPESIAVSISFSDPLARQIYAGSDLFAMPSRYEPCGLGQMISMAYGTVPVV
ncbi:MAG TPA: glycogen/starch synthase, partial [Armatimonadota bacterium]|nr:glycogen/starch synthase [Armatimonadota bacterium]